MAPPFGPDEDAELQMPAVRDLVVGVQVVEAVPALLLALKGVNSEHRALGEIAQLKPVLLVDCLRLRARSS